MDSKWLPCCLSLSGLLYQNTMHCETYKQQKPISHSFGGWKAEHVFGHRDDTPRFQMANSLGSEQSRGSILITSPNSNYFPKLSPPDMIALRSRVSKYKYWEDINIQPVTSWQIESTKLVFKILKQI